MKKKYLYPLFMSVGFMICSHTDDASPTPFLETQNTRSQLKDIGTTDLAPIVQANGIVRPSVPYSYLVTAKNDTLVLVDREIFEDAYGQEFLEKNRLGTATRMIGTKRKTSLFDNEKCPEVLVQFKDNDKIEHEYYTFSESRNDFTPNPKYTGEYDVLPYSKELCGPIAESYAEALAKSNKSQPNILFLALKSD